MFLGRALSLESEPPPPEWPKLEDGREYIGLPRVAEFEVVEGFRGAGTGRIQIHTGSGGGDCGYTLDVGKVYLVYAYRSKNRQGEEVLKTSICNRTDHELSERAQQDLAYLRSQKSSQPFGTISGNIVALEQGIGRTKMRARRLADILVRATGATTIEAQTRIDGRFRLDRVPLGNYSVEASVPPIYVHTRPDPGQDNLDDEDDDDEETIEATTDRDGRYIFEHMPAGRYVIGVGTDSPPTPKSPFRMIFYPTSPTRSGAQVIELKEGQHQAGIDLDVGLPFEEQIIRVKVTAPAGKPFAYLHDPEFPDEETVEGTESADETGWITLKALRGRTYWVHAGTELARES